MKKYIYTALIILSNIQLFCQEFELTEKYEFKEKQDYVDYEEDVIKAIDWIFATPIHSNKEKEKAVHGFIISWITGSPTVTVEIKPEIVTFMETNPELMVIFMYGWTKYAIEYKENNKIQGNMKGIEAAIDFYNANKNALEKDKNLEKYIKIKERGELEEYVTKVVK